LNVNEVRAVVAHEVYHYKNSPNKILSSLLAFLSLTFIRFNDERLADLYAAEVVGSGTLASALRKLDIRNYNKRLSGFMENK